MLNLTVINRTPPGLKVPAGAVTPEYIRVSQARAVYGLTRSSIYRLAVAGLIRLVKFNGQTFIDCSTVRAHFASLPAPDLKLPSTPVKKPKP